MCDHSWHLPVSRTPCSVSILLLDPPLEGWLTTAFLKNLIIFHSPLLCCCSIQLMLSAVLVTLRDSPRGRLYSRYTPILSIWRSTPISIRMLGPVAPVNTVIAFLGVVSVAFLVNVMKYVAKQPDRSNYITCELSTFHPNRENRWLEWLKAVALDA